MKINLECISHNIQLLEEVKIEYPILQDYIDNKVQRKTVQNVGLDGFVGFIDYIRIIESRNMSLIYKDKIKYKSVKDKICELTQSVKPKNIFSKKSKKDFNEIWNNNKILQRYNRPRNVSYCVGLESASPIIWNYLVQNDIEVSSIYNLKAEYYYNKLSKPTYYARDLKITQDFIDKFINYAKDSNLDIRKCNVRALVSELQSKLEVLANIETGLMVKCISDIKGFTTDNLYVVQDSRLNYLGYLEIKLTSDSNVTTFYPYSNFEEVSRQRDDILSSLGI